LEGFQLGNKLHVGNLSDETSKSDLEKLFAAHGTVVSAQIITDRETQRSRHFGFVEMESEEQARAAIAGLNGKELAGQAITVNEARPKEQHSDAGGAPRRGPGAGGAGRGGHR
jgi:RNA recognition motif-containing protein